MSATKTDTHIAAETAWEAGYRFAVLAWSMRLDDPDALVELAPCDYARRNEDVGYVLAAIDALKEARAAR